MIYCNVRKGFLAVLPIVQFGCTDMKITQIVGILNSQLKSEQKKKEALNNLLLKEQISNNIYDLMDKRISNTMSITQNLRETLSVDMKMWETNMKEEAKVLELLLIELEHKHLLGEIEDKKFVNNSKLICQGLDTLRNKAKPARIAQQEPTKSMYTRIEKKSSIKPISIPILSTQKEPKPVQKNPPTEIMVLNNQKNMNSKTLPRRNKPLTANNPHKQETANISKPRCMNPWKPNCENTDINLSIYYEEHKKPICHQCWDEIAKRNIEWSSL